MHVLVCASMYEFRGQNSIKGGRMENPGKNSIFLKNGKTVISVEKKNSRSWMMKQTSLLNSSRKI